MYIPKEVEAHAIRRAALVEKMRAIPANAHAPLGIKKHDSNLFRDRHEGKKSKLDLSEFCHVLDIDTVHGWVDVEGMTSYEALVEKTLPWGVMPAVVPQLKTITVGGAVAGVGIEATSHQFGLVHHTVLELDVLLPGGELVHCTPYNEHRDLFFGFPNSYGTLGYALRVRLCTQKVKPFVKIKHLQQGAPAEFFCLLAAHCGTGADFVDGVVFGPQQQVVNVACFVDEAPWLSDYSFEKIYYRSLQSMPVDYMRTQDYLWRWDTDWFWCSKNLYAHKPLVRYLLGRERLNSRTYSRVMRWNARWGLTRVLNAVRGRHCESVIQDVDIPIARASDFLAFLVREIGILPIWICPVRTPIFGTPWALYPMQAGSLYVNFGFWDVVKRSTSYPPGHFNRLIEREVMRLGGIKSLYSESYFTPEEFDQMYGLARHQTLKSRYDPTGRMLGLYEKCVLRA
jgi:FAD/FMN-containing dehydrogenase